MHRDPSRSRKITLQREEDVAHWTRTFGVSRSLLLATIKNVGNTVEAVADVLGRSQLPPDKSTPRRSEVSSVR
jgi:Protein of unknown function (DUF3606)